MNLDIRENIINKIKDDTETDIINTIDESVITSNELVLPGLGVILELFWNNLNQEDKKKIANIIKKNISK